MLSVLLVILLAVRMIAFRPGRGESVMTGEENAEAAIDADYGQEIPEPFLFDPNNASRDDLLRLGLTGRQASTLINYRNSGARFRRPEDINRVYGIDSVTSLRLIPYIRIETAKEVVIPVHKEKQIVEAKPGITEGHKKELLDINRCSAWELEQLPGIGPVLSVRIIRYRHLLGGFVSKGQLNEVYGLDSSVVSIISAKVMISYDSVVPVVLGSASFTDLARHPYLGYEMARVITRYRSFDSVPLTLGGMVRDKVITAAQAERIAPYVMPPPDVTGDDYEFISSKVLK